MSLLNPYPKFFLEMPLLKDFMIKQQKRKMEFKSHLALKITVNIFIIMLFRLWLNSHALRIGFTYLFWGVVTKFWESLPLEKK